MITAELKLVPNHRDWKDKSQVKCLFLLCNKCVTVLEGCAIRLQPVTNTVLIAWTYYLFKE